MEDVAREQAGCLENTQASLSSPFGRGTVPAQPSNGFLKHLPDLLKDIVSKMLEGKYFLDKEA